MPSAASVTDSDCSSTPWSRLARHALLLHSLTQQPAPLCVLDKNIPSGSPHHVRTDLGMGRISPTTFPLGRCPCSWLTSAALLGGPAGSRCPALRELLLHTGLYQSPAHTDTRQTVWTWPTNPTSCCFPLCIYCSVYGYSVITCPCEH